MSALSRLWLYIELYVAFIAGGLLSEASDAVLLKQHLLLTQFSVFFVQYIKININIHPSTQQQKQNREKRPTWHTRWIITNMNSPSVQTLWTLGKWASEYLDSLSKNSRNKDGKLNTAEFRCYWRNRSAVTLQCCKATVTIITRKHHNFVSSCQ